MQAGQARGGGTRKTLASLPVVPISPSQLVWRRRIETGLKVVAPVLDLVLLAGEQLSKAVDRDGVDAPPPARRIDAA